MSPIREKAHEYLPYVEAFREECHRHPEPSMHEVETTNRLAKALDELGISYRRLDPTGLCGEIKGGKPGKTVALRADIDALSIQEKTDFPYKSEVDGMMHACGHDTHQACLLGALRILNDMKDELPGNVRFIFQPAEETAQGAKLCVEQGCLDGVDAAYGQHIWGLLPVGGIQYAYGPSFASCDGFQIKIHGKTSHGSAPEQGVDASVCAAAVVMNLQSIVSREVATTNPLVVTVGTIHSGARWNIVSGEAELAGTCREFDPELQKHIPEMMERIVKGTCDAYRCTYEFHYDMMTAPVYNNDKLVDLALAAAKKVVDDPSMVKTHEPIMGAEDFSAFQDVCPCVFGLLGGGGHYPQHSEHFDVDDKALEYGTATYAQFAYDFLNQK